MDGVFIMSKHQLVLCCNNLMYQRSHLGRLLLQGLEFPESLALLGAQEALVSMRALPNE